MAYRVKEAFLTLQGEGAQAGRAAVFCRFSGCNLWSGQEQDRNTAHCRFCDTDFVGVDGDGGGRFLTPEDLAAHLRALWDAEARGGTPYIVFTGGEPLLQLDVALIAACKALGFALGVETNGTLPAPEGLDWICVSPKPGPPLVLTDGHELKLIFPQAELAPDRFESLGFTHFFLQPMDGPLRQKNTELCASYVRQHPHWRLSLQTHKLIGIP